MMNNTIHNSKFFDRLSAKEIMVRNEGTLKGHIDGEPVVIEGDVTIKMNPLSMKIIISK